MSSIYGNGRAAAAVLRSRFKKEINAYSSDADSDVSSSNSRNFLCVGCCYNSCFIHSCSCCAEMTHYMRAHTHTHSRTRTDYVAQIYPNKAKYRQRERERETEMRGITRTATRQQSAVQCPPPPHHSHTPGTVFLLSNFHL